VTEKVVLNFVTKRWVRLEVSSSRPYISSPLITFERTENWFKRHATGDHVTFVIFNLLPSVVSATRSCEFMRWKRH